MGRKTNATKIIENLPENTGEHPWLVVYDFIGFKPSHRFWDNLERLTEALGGSLIQYSVFLAADSRGALAVSQLAKQYGAEVQSFRAEYSTTDNVRIGYRNPE